jgi:hypothetical protein
MKKCCVFVCNEQYFDKFLNTCSALINTGKYTGDICLIVGDDLNNSPLLNNEFIIKNNIIIKYFENIQFPQSFYEINNNIVSDNRNIIKKFQWHKLHLFNVYLKNWDYIFYIDCGIHILDDITPMLSLFTKDKLVAHSDTYPIYEWKLKDQFDKNTTQLYNKLENEYNLNIDYFQTTILMYDTNIIEDNTFNDLLKLSIDYPISKTNEQGIIALYFTNIKAKFEQIETHNENIYFYDYLSRNYQNKYIMLKSI